MKRRRRELKLLAGCILAVLLLGQACVNNPTPEETSTTSKSGSETSRDQKMIDQVSDIKDALIQNNSEIAKRRGEYQKSEARSELTVAYQKQKQYKAEHGTYSDDPEVVYQSLLGTPQMTLRYVYGLKPSCEKGADAPVQTILSAQENPLAFETKESLEVINKQLKSLDIPCKPLKQGFTLLAIGMVRGASQPDIWSIDEQENLILVQDGHEELESD